MTERYGNITRLGVYMRAVAQHLSATTQMNAVRALEVIGPRGPSVDLGYAMATLQRLVDRGIAKRGSHPDYFLRGPFWSEAAKYYRWRPEAVTTIRLLAKRWDGAYEDRPADPVTEAEWNAAVGDFSGYVRGTAANLAAHNYDVVLVGNRILISTAWGGAWFEKQETVRGGKTLTEEEMDALYPWLEVPPERPISLATERRLDREGARMNGNRWRDRNIHLEALEKLVNGDVA